MYALHADVAILPPFELMARHFPAARAEKHFAEVEGADEHCELTNGQVGSFLVQMFPRGSVSFRRLVLIIDWICESSAHFRSAAS